jgi:hypothetical protein
MMSKKVTPIERILIRQNERLLDILAIHAGAGGRTQGGTSGLLDSLFKTPVVGNGIKKKSKLTKKQLQALANGRQILKAKQTG